MSNTGAMSQFPDFATYGANLLQRKARPFRATVPSGLEERVAQVSMVGFMKEEIFEIDDCMGAPVVLPPRLWCGSKGVHFRLDLRVVGVVHVGARGAVHFDVLGA